MNKIVQDGSRGGRNDWKQRPHPGMGKTGTTATLVQLEGRPERGWEQEGPGWVPSSPAILCPPKCSDSVPLTPTWATAASESVPSSNSKSRPSPPQPLPSLGIWSLLYRAGLGEEAPSQTLLLYLPPPRPLGWSSKTPSSVLAQAGCRTRGLEPHRRKRLRCSLSLPKGRVQTWQEGWPYWLAPGAGLPG